MKIKDRVYRDLRFVPGTTRVGTVTATSAEGDADVYEGETVEVKWDGGKTETVAVEDLDRLEAHS